MKMPAEVYTVPPEEAYSLNLDELKTTITTELQSYNKLKQPLSKQPVNILKQPDLLRSISQCCRNQKSIFNECQTRGVKTSKDDILRKSLNCENNAQKSTEIQSFYEGKNILITGATGFLGKILLDKLLRCCPGVENLYIIVRQKRGKDIYSRVDDVFEDPVFDRLKSEKPKFRHKVVVVPGDCSAAGLGLNIADRQLLIEKVNIIFHVAATVKFDEELKVALATNVRAPLHLLRLARDMKHFHVFMHVSTAYSHCHVARIEERFYPCPVDRKELEMMVDKLSAVELDRLLPKILGPWPNTYTFTKALAEHEIRRNCGALAVGIFRPAIVMSTAKDPIPNWIDNMYGPTGVAAGAATGVLRTLHCDPDVTADMVPVDMVVNCLVAAARAVYMEHSKRKPSWEPPIYNYVSSVENRITWQDMTDIIKKYGFTHPLNSAIWYSCILMNRSATVNQICVVILHWIPAYLMDALALCSGRKPQLVKMYKKIHKFSSVISYFCTTEIQFCNKEVRALWDSTSREDQQLFPFSMAQLNWKQYFGGYIKGIRSYLMKESDDSLERARRKWNRLYYLHQTVKILFYTFIFYVSFRIFSIMLRVVY